MRGATDGGSEGHRSLLFWGSLGCAGLAEVGKRGREAYAFSAADTMEEQG